MTERNNKNRRKTTTRSKNAKRGRHRKKNRINKFRLVLFILAIVAALFVGSIIIKKAVGFGTQVWPNVIYIKNVLFDNDDKNAKVDNKEQFDLEDENKDKLTKKINVFVDVGKGGNDTGYILNKDVSEKVINLKVAENLAKRLARYDDVNVILSRQEDVFLSAAERKDLAISANADLFVSINLASEASGKADGIETIYGTDANPASVDFANIMQTSIAAHVEAKNRGIGTYDMSVLRENEMPSIYVQYGFLSNKEEAKKLTSQKYQDQLAEGLAQGILGYIDAQK